VARTLLVVEVDVDDRLADYPDGDVAGVEALDIARRAPSSS